MARHASLCRTLHCLHILQHCRAMAYTAAQMMKAAIGAIMTRGVKMRIITAPMPNPKLMHAMALASVHVSVGKSRGWIEGPSTTRRSPSRMTLSVVGTRITEGDDINSAGRRSDAGLINPFMLRLKHCTSYR